MAPPKEPAIVTLRGDGGSCWEFDLSFIVASDRANDGAGVIANQIRNGQLRPVDSDSARALADAGFVVAT